MSRRFIATIVCIALAVTAIGTAPARANEDLARALAAIVGVAVIGNVIRNKLDDDDDDDDYKEVYRNRLDDRYEKVRPWYRDSYESDRFRNDTIRRVEPRPLPRRVERKLLPGDCLRSWRTNEGRARVFGEKCLKKNFRYTGSLPKDCKVRYRVKNKKRKGYDARCLRREGYQLARR